MKIASIGKTAFMWLLLSSISGAFGHESADLATTPSVSPFNESESAAILQEIKLFANARISARRAIAIAERRDARAKVIDLSFDATTSRLAYRVKVLLNEQLWEGAIDASTGVPVDDGSTTPASRLGEEDRTALAAFTAAGMDLSEAIAIAEQYGSGKAVSAGLQHDGAKLVLPVVIVSEGSLKEISVEPGERPSRRLRKAPVRGNK
jgi:uncharacterized membrane protein YkoI